MRILIIGSGGREHAIAWKLAQSGHKVFGAPGNPGIAAAGTVLNSTDYMAGAEHVKAELTVVGPEVPLVAGIVDEFRAAGRPIVGPTQANARLEGSKIFAKQFMEDAAIPTARSVRIPSEEEGLRRLADFQYPVVIKADGLAAGKGVVIAQDRVQAEEAIRSLGPRLLIEEFLEGEEVSFIVLSDGRNIVPFEATQDHKAVYDGDRGPNTGGMGAYCDGRIIDESTADLVIRKVIEPVIERTGFTGFLYAGLMMTADGPKVLEFNVRLGDPEAQALMHRMDGDFGALLWAATTNELSGKRAVWRPEPSVCVVLAAQGYPGPVRTGDPIEGIEQCPAEVFQAGVRQEANHLVTAGGRVLGVTARGADLASAIENAYAAVRKIHFAGMHYRTDVGRKGLKRW
jgi:phosphoribosylamine---glycine ligase